MAALYLQLSGLQHHSLTRNTPRISWTSKGLSIGLPWRASLSRSASSGAKISSCLVPSPRDHGSTERSRIHVISPEISAPSIGLEALDALDDDYNGVIIDPYGLPSSANAFASALKTSLYHWKLKGKKGVWLKILEPQAELVPIAIQEGFNYHHAEPGYVLLTYWIPDEPCLLPAGPSHQIGVGGFVINDKREVLVVKEKCPCNCSDVWKLPTGYINKAEDLFSGAVREVKEETGVDTSFLKMIAFRHVHLVAFEKSDLLFVCMLKPLTDEISIDDKEIEAAQWMPFEEFISQPYYKEDHMSKKVIDSCMAAYDEQYGGFIAHQLPSKLDGKMSCLYYEDCSNSI